MHAENESARPEVERIRENFSRLLRDVNAGDPQELAQALVGDDGETSLAVLEAFPRMLEAAVRTVKALAEHLEGLPPERAVQAVDLALSRLDGGAIGEAVNSLSRLMIRLHEKDPGLLARRRLAIAAAALRAVDFGKLRKALIFRAEENLELLRGEAEALGDNPVALVNLFSVVPPVINQALKVLQKLFEVLNMPAEAMSYALFNMLEDLGWRGIAEVINGAAGVVVNLHRGNLILGEGSPYSATPFSRIGSELAAGLQGPLLAEAVAALAEEGETVVTTLVDQALRDEVMAVSLVEAAVSLANGLARTAASLFESLYLLPPETMRGIKEALARALDTEGTARAIHAFLEFGRRARQESPGLLSRIGREVASSLKAERTSLISYHNLAGRANRALQAFNRRAVAGRSAGSAASGFLERLDYVELDRAAGNAASFLSAMLAAHPELAGIALRTFSTIIFQSIKGYLTGRWSRLRGRR